MDELYEVCMLQQKYDKVTHASMFQIQSQSSLSPAAKQQPSLRSITIIFRLKKKLALVRVYAFCPKSKRHFLNFNLSSQFQR